MVIVDFYITFVDTSVILLLSSSLIPVYFFCYFWFYLFNFYNFFSLIFFFTNVFRILITILISIKKLFRLLGHTAHIHTDTSIHSVNTLHHTDTKNWWSLLLFSVNIEYVFFFILLYFIVSLCIIFFVFNGFWWQSKHWKVRKIKKKKKSSSVYMISFLLYFWCLLCVVYVSLPS